MIPEKGKIIHDAHSIIKEELIVSDDFDFIDVCSIGMKNMIN